MSTPTFRLRPGSARDLTHAVRLYDACFGNDMIVALLFPSKAADPAGYKTYLYRLYAKRYWSLEWTLTFVVTEGEEDGKEEEEVVGFTCWKRASADIGFTERWFSLFSWIAPIMRSYISLADFFSPASNIDVYAAHAFDRCLPPVETAVFAGKHRPEWWYLSTLAVQPSHQGRGLGSLLVNDGLAVIDAWEAKQAARRGQAQDQNENTTKVRGKVWLIGLRGTDAFYARFGFAEVGRANVGEMSEWDGGIVMFRE